jgi:hypothetical protein
MKLSSKVKYAGIIIGGLSAIYIIFKAMDLLMANKPALVILGIGALIYFIGAWLKRKGK